MWPFKKKVIGSKTKDAFMIQIQRSLPNDPDEYGIEQCRYAPNERTADLVAKTAYDEGANAEVWELIKVYKHV